MINPKTGQRELCYLTKIDAIEPIEGKDRVECARVGGWTIMVRKGQFKPGDLGIYFEIDSKVPETEPFKFLAPKKYKIKTQKYGSFYSQGLLMSAEDFGWDTQIEPLAGVRTEVIIDGNGDFHYPDDETRFLTKVLGVTYSVKEDRKRKGKGIDKYASMSQRRPDIFKRPWARWMMRREWGRKLMFLIFGKKKDSDRKFPTKFEYIHKTDQERVENMAWVLESNENFIRTQKCDGSSATYILERKKSGKNKFEFYVCSRNVRMLRPDQETFFGEDNPYWDMAIKYDIEDKLTSIMKAHPELMYVCWQGEICGPKIQKNPHKLKENHLFLFHMITSDVGMWNIREAAALWKAADMEYVPIENIDIKLEDNMEDFKLTADGNYDASVCEGQTNCRREGYVYYKVDDPNFSFKNVSRKYLLKKGE